MNPRAQFSPVARREFLGRLSIGAASLALPAPLFGAAPRKLGVALVGLGSYSRGQLGPALKVTENCWLAGVVTGNRAKGLQWVKDYGFPETSVYSYETMPQLADNRDIDIVYVVTPNGLHSSHAIAAARVGKHVISEKPMANTVAECDAMLAACRAAKVKMSIGYRLHFDPYHQELMRLAREREFGPLLKMKGDRGFVMGTKVWRADKKLAGGGAMMDLGVYIIQGACMAQADATAAGREGLGPIAVTATEIPKTRPDIFTDVEQGTRWTMEFANGAVCEAYTSYAHGADTFRAEGDQGWLDFKEHAFTYRGMVVATSRGPLKLGPDVNQQARQMDDFALCIREGRESRVPGEMGRRDLAIVEAIYESVRTGQRTLVKA
ncbi:MAG: Gfo/Idh/MocA family oxidoreductase [Opitutus sp.]|nr:Gfo/Idh/MocA family oxidoreductase [Opitutus sp.]